MSHAAAAWVQQALQAEGYRLMDMIGLLAAAAGGVCMSCHAQPAVTVGDHQPWPTVQTRHARMGCKIAMTPEERTYRICSSSQCLVWVLHLGELCFGPEPCQTVQAAEQQTDGRGGAGCARNHPVTTGMHQALANSTHSMLSCTHQHCHQCAHGHTSTCAMQSATAGSTWHTH